MKVLIKLRNIYPYNRHIPLTDCSPYLTNDQTEEDESFGGSMYGVEVH